MATRTVQTMEEDTFNTWMTIVLNITWTNTFTLVWNQWSSREKSWRKMPIRSSWMRERRLNFVVWLRHWIGCADASAAASILASTFPDPSVAQVIAGNDVVRHLKLPIRLKSHAIKEANLKNLLIADSAFDLSGKEKFQFGWLMGFTDKTLNQGAKAPVSLMQWRSTRLRRKAASSMMCESIAVSAATGALERQDAFMHSIRFSNYSPRLRQKGEYERMDMLGKTSVFAKDVSAFRDPASVVVMDAKALLDNLGSEQSQGEDDRAALEVAIIKESLLAVGGRPRWIPHNVNPSDALTKVDGAHVEPMLQVLRSNSFQIEAEDEVLQRGRQSENRLKTGAKHVVGTSTFGGCETSYHTMSHSNYSCIPHFACAGRFTSIVPQAPWGTRI